MGILSDIEAAGDSDAGDLLRDPRGYIFSAVAIWVVKNVFIGPSVFILAMIEDAGTRIQDAIAMVDASVSSGVSPAARGLSSAWDSVITGLSAPLVDAGLGAPTAVSLVTVLILVVVVTVVVLLARIALDVIPGGGAFL